MDLKYRRNLPSAMATSSFLQLRNTLQISHLSKIFVEKELVILVILQQTKKEKKKTTNQENPNQNPKISRLRNANSTNSQISELNIVKNILEIIYI